MVGAGGIEPPRAHVPRDFKSRMSTSSITLPRNRSLRHGLRGERKFATIFTTALFVLSIIRTILNNCAHVAHRQIETAEDRAGNYSVAYGEFLNGIKGGNR